MAFDTLFPEITQPAVSSTTPVTGTGGTSLADAWKGYQTLKTQNTFTEETGHPDDYWTGSNNDQVNSKYAIPDAGQYLRQQGWYAPQFTNLSKYSGFDPSSMYAPGATREGAGTNRFSGLPEVYAYRMQDQFKDDAAFAGAMNPYYQSGGGIMGKAFHTLTGAKALGINQDFTDKLFQATTLTDPDFANKNVDWVVPAALAAMGGYAAMGATGALGAAGSGTAGAGTTAGAGATTAGAAPLFGEAAVAGAPTVGAGGALGATSLGTGTLATEGLGAGSLWGGASGAMTAGAGATAGGTSLFGEGIGDLTNMAANEGVTTPMADTVNDGWLFDQMGTELPSGTDLAGDLATSQAGGTGYMGNMAPQSGGLTMPSLTDLAKFGYSIYNNQQQNQRAMQLYQQAQQGMKASDPFAPGRATALQQYQQMAQDPMSYMSSPLAQMQIDQMNRAQRAKQAQLGDTWSINPTTGAIQGSGTGAVDFATQMQQNLAKQYETALQNRAQQAGMNLFPNAQMLQQLGQATGMQNTAGNTGAGLFGYGVDLAKQTGVLDWGMSQLGGLFGA